MSESSNPEVIKTTTVNDLPIGSLWKALESKDRETILKLSDEARSQTENMLPEVREWARQLLLNIKVHATQAPNNPQHWQRISYCLGQLVKMR